MARYKRGKIALYEVLSKSNYKSSHNKTLENLHPEKPAEVEPIVDTTEQSTPQLATQWWRKPRIFQFNAGRVEFSMPYPVGIGLVLGIVLMVLVAFRLGQFTNPNRREVNETGKEAFKTEQKNPIRQLPVVKPEITKKVEKIAPADAKATFTSAKANNVLVIVEYSRQADLVPVQKHFAELGIQTEIANWSGKYFLITKDRYESFVLGSDGDKARQKIIDAGAKYKGKAPEGYESFAPRYFNDPYGKKIE